MASTPPQKYLQPTGHLVDKINPPSAEALKKEVHDAVLSPSVAAGYKCGPGRPHRWVVRCTSCQLIISREQALKDNVIFTLDRFWHKDHFTCIRCNIPIADSQIDFRPCSTDPSRPVCIDCHMDENHPPCARCKKPLKEKAMLAMDKQWHKGCFTCSKCNGPMPDNEFYIYQGKQYDVDCYFLQKYDRVIGVAPSPPVLAFVSDPSSSAASTTSAASSKPAEPPSPVQTDENKKDKSSNEEPPKIIPPNAVDKSNNSAA